MATKIGVPPAPQTKGVALSKEEIMRYSRHLIMPEVGMEGQLKIKAAKVLCIGTGGLGAYTDHIHVDTAGLRTWGALP